MYQNINHQLSRILYRMAAIYEFLGDPYRARAYSRAARLIEALPDDIRHLAEEHRLKALRGIGPRIAAKIEEFIQTGKISRYEELRRKVPEDFLDLLDLPGLGPKSLKKIHDELGITTKEELLQALRDGRIARLEGFGPKKVEKILKAFERQELARRRILLWEALQIARHLEREVGQIAGIERVQVAGSLRRRRETIGDFDLLGLASEERFSEIMRRFVRFPEVEEVLVEGPRKSSVVMRFGGERRQVDFRLFKREEWGAALQYFTGSKQHNVHLREIAKERGLKLNEYGVFRIEDGARVAGETEEGVYGALGMACPPPEIREDQGEIEAALSGQLPSLVDYGQVKGDLHLHSTWTDGAFSLREIALYVREKFPHYRYLVVTDHSQAVKVANGLTPERLIAQRREIDAVNAELGEDFLKQGIELDILPDGTLDLPDEALARLDWVVASIHSQFNRDNTDRILRAMENPYVNAIGHLSGRLIGQRDPYPVDIERVVEKAKETGTALEINAQPRRMDLKESWVRFAREAGVKLVVNSDSHHLGHFDYMEIGIAIARRGWCGREDLLNTGPWERIAEFVDRKRFVRI